MLDWIFGRIGELEKAQKRNEHLETKASTMMAARDAALERAEAAEQVVAAEMQRAEAAIGKKLELKAERVVLRARAADAEQALQKIAERLGHPGMDEPVAEPAE
jgi:hypothetical protein